MCDPKSEGGLGFRHMKAFNLASLAKLGWRLIRRPNSLVSRLLKCRYFPNSSFMHASAEPGCSYTWRSLMSGREVLKRGLRFLVGNGEDILIWEDPWLPLPHHFKPFSLPMEGTGDWSVAMLIDNDNHVWLEDLVRDLFNEDEREMLSLMALSERRPKDRLMWHYDKYGIYSVRTGYHVAR